MLKKTLIILFVGLCTLFAQAQQTYSKMFDAFGEWESAGAPFNINEKSFYFHGTTRNFGAADSTQYRRGCIFFIDSNQNVSTKIVLGKNKFWFSTYRVFNPAPNKNILFYNVQYDTSGTYGNYKLIDINEKGDSSNERTIEFQGSNLGLNLSFNIKNKIYLFGFDGIGSLDPFTILCSDTSGKQIWYKKFAGKRTRASSVVLGNDGHFLLGGYVYRGDGISDSTFGWYAKMDTAGNLLWEKTMDLKSPYPNNGCFINKVDTNLFIVGNNDASYSTSFNKDTSYISLMKIDGNGNTIWYKRPYISPWKKNVYAASFIERNGTMYGLGGLETDEGHASFTQYIMLVKLDLQGNLIWKRLFKQWFRDNRAWSLTAVNDGFIICADGKDSTHTTGFTDAWIIKTDTNGCVVPGCHLKDGLVQLLNPELLLSIYPNPANNQLYITITDNRAALKSVVVYDALGNQTTLPQQTFNSTQAILNTTLLQTGYYYVVIELLTGERAVKKVLVGH